MVALAAVPDGNGTQCRANLSSLGPPGRVRDTEVSAFGVENHPDFPDPNTNDARPLRLNHAVHVPAEPKQPPPERRWVWLRLKVGLRLKPPEEVPAQSRLKAWWAR